MEFSRPEYWSGVPFPIPGDLPDPGIKPMSPASPALAGRFFATEPPGKPKITSSRPKRLWSPFSIFRSSGDEENVRWSDQNWESPNISENSPNGFYFSEPGSGYLLGALSWSLGP